MQNLKQSHLTRNRNSDLYSFRNWLKQKERIYVKDSYKENDLQHINADSYETHTRIFSRWICNKERVWVIFNLILVKWDIEVHASTLQK